MINEYLTNTLQFNQDLCNNCIMCSTVCPHAVFERMNHEPLNRQALSIFLIPYLIMSTTGTDLMSDNLICCGIALIGFERLRRSLDTGCWMLDTGYSILDARYWSLDAGCSILDTRYSILDAGCWILDTGCSMLDAGYSMLDESHSALRVDGVRNSEVGMRKIRKSK